MIKMSTRSTYALKALIDLARYAHDRPERLNAIAERQHIPLPYLEQIFSKLKKAGLVQALRGPQGGYQLSKSTTDISLADIVTALEGPLGPALCSQPEKRSSTCHDVDGCLSRHMCNELDGAIHHVLRKNTLASLCGEAERLNNRAVA
jgi:Rrf2 family protein